MRKADMATINTDYLDDLVKRFKGFKSPNDTQQLIIILGEKDNRSEDDNRKLAVLMKAERKADQLAKARADARRLIDADKAKARKAEVRRKLIWMSALEKMADTDQEANHRLRMLMQDAFNEGFVSDRDKDVVRDDI
jgi:predicted solute-binding protein